MVLIVYKQWVGLFTYDSNSVDGDINLPAATIILPSRSIFLYHRDDAEVRTLFKGISLALEVVMHN